MVLYPTIQHEVAKILCFILCYGMTRLLLRLVDRFHLTEYIAVYRLFVYSRETGYTGLILQHVRTNCQSFSNLDRDTAAAINEASDHTMIRLTTR